MQKRGFIMQETQRNEEFIEVIRKRLGEKRFNHSMCVAQAARELAEQYGADPERAYTAGILHDVMKEAPGEEQLQTIASAGIILTDVERANQKLWHAVAGYAYCRDTLHVTDSGILDAIRYHTTGRADMTLLEKCVYIADFISADRDYPGVEEIRACARRGLTAVMLEGMKFTIAELAEKGQAIHPDTVAAYNQIIISDSEGNQ